jgi:hypothetical protein
MLPLDLLVISLILLLRIRLTGRHTGLSQGVPRPVYGDEERRRCEYAGLEVIDLGAGRWALATLAWPMSWTSLESRPGTLHRYPGAGVPAWRPHPDGDLESAWHGAEMPARPGGSPGEGVPGHRMAAQQRSAGALDGGPTRCRPRGGSPGLAVTTPNLSQIRSARYMFHHNPRIIVVIHIT